MKAKFTIGNDSRLNPLTEAATRDSFYIAFFSNVLREKLGVANPFDRPAAYYAQEPDRSVVLKADALGVVFQLTGMSRDGRTSRAIMEAYAEACRMVLEFVVNNTPMGVAVHVMVQFALDAPIEVGRGQYASLVDTYEEWVEGKAELRGDSVG